MTSKIADNQDLDMQAIIAIVQEQYPDWQDLVVALQNSIGGHWRGKAYFQFVDPTNANKPGAEWQHDDCIVIDETNILIDFFKDGQIDGIEFLSLLN